ncbi:septum formation initiator family protein [Patescibacteria group bacterium]|nr:septum formation initiator family protein [Patescibacteria group bacterium]
MFRKDKKNLLTRFLLNKKTLALVGLAVIVLISFPLAKNISQRYKISQEIKELEAEINNLENQNTNLKEFMNYLESDQFVEERARLNLGLKKEGEEVAVISGEPLENNGNKEESAATGIFGIEKEEPDEPAGNPRKWWRYFFNYSPF